MTLSSRALPRHALIRHVFLRHPPLPQAQGLCYGRLDLPLPSYSFDDTAARLLRDPIDTADLQRESVAPHADFELESLEDMASDDIVAEAHATKASTNEVHTDEMYAAMQRLPILSSPAQRCLGLARALHRLRVSAAEKRAVSNEIAVDAATSNFPATNYSEANYRAPLVETRLLEMDFGDWEGRTWSDVPREQLDLWASDVAGYRMPGGESFVDVVARVGGALADLREPHLIVTHGGVIRAAWHLLGGRTLTDAAAQPIAYAAPMLIPLIK